MSFELGFFAIHQGETSVEKIEELYNKVMRNEQVEWNSNEQFDLFKAELFAEHPPLDENADDDEYDDSAWACDVLHGEGYICVSVGRGPVSSSAIDLIEVLANKYRVATVNPQASPPENVMFSSGNQ